MDGLSDMLDFDPNDPKAVLAKDIEELNSLRNNLPKKNTNPKGTFLSNFSIHTSKSDLADGLHASLTKIQKNPNLSPIEMNKKILKAFDSFEKKRKMRSFFGAKDHQIFEETEKMKMKHLNLKPKLIINALTDKVINYADEKVALDPVLEEIVNRRKNDIDKNYAVNSTPVSNPTEGKITKVGSLISLYLPKLDSTEENRDQLAIDSVGEYLKKVDPKDELKKDDPKNKSEKKEQKNEIVNFSSIISDLNNLKVACNRLLAIAPNAMNEEDEEKRKVQISTLGRHKDRIQETLPNIAPELSKIITKELVKFERSLKELGIKKMERYHQIDAWSR